MNALTSFTVSGAGKSLVATNFFSLDLITFSEIMCPANSISGPILNFFSDIVMLFSLHLSSTILVW